MLLFDSLHMASAAMNAAQLGMQVSGQNLTNAQTPGYVRENLVLQTGTSRKLGNGVVVGTGVSAAGVEQVIDNFLEERLRTSTSDAMSSSMQEKYYTQLEALLNETTDVDLSSSIESFFNSIDEIANHPENVTYREMAAKQGQKLAEDINRLAGSVIEMQHDVNTTIEKTAEEINRLLEEIETLNKQITVIESSTKQDALGLRDQRLNALTSLASYVNIKTHENPDNGQVTIYCGSDLLLSDGVRNEVVVDKKKNEGSEISQSILCIRDIKTPLDIRSGAVYGLYEAHETILGGYLKQLDGFANDLVREFNNIYTSGQGMSGYSDLTSLARVQSPDQPLNTADLDFPIENGGFKIQLYDSKTDTTTEHYIEIKAGDVPKNDPFSLKPTPQATGTSLEDIATAINGIENISAKVNAYGQLEISSNYPNIQFAFAEDSSGVLPALGLNTFFTGTSAATIGVNQTVVDDGSKFAASAGGVGFDVDQAVQLAAMGIGTNSNLGGLSFADEYGRIVSEVMLSGNMVKSAAASDITYQQSLQAQRDSLSGVNIDEETILMMTYQRMFQANSRFVTMVDEMLATLINL